MRIVEGGNCKKWQEGRPRYEDKVVSKVTN